MRPEPIPPGHARKRGSPRFRPRNPRKPRMAKRRPGAPPELRPEPGGGPAEGAPGDGPERARRVRRTVPGTPQRSPLRRPEKSTPPQLPRPGGPRLPRRRKEPRRAGGPALHVADAPRRRQLWEPHRRNRNAGADKRQGSSKRNSLLPLKRPRSQPRRRPLEPDAGPGPRAAAAGNGRSRWPGQRTRPCSSPRSATGTRSPCLRGGR